MNIKNKTIQILLVIWFVALVTGSIGLVQKFITHDRLAGYGSYVPWGLWVAIYFHCIGIAGGIFISGILGYFLNIKLMRTHIRITLWGSLVAIITGLLAIWLDLGKPWRAHSVITSANFTSMMAFNSWMYLVFSLNLMICFILSLKRKNSFNLNDGSGWLAPFLLFGSLMSLAFPSQSGVFFGVVDAKPFWNSALMPILFLASAVTSGTAVLLLSYTFLLDEHMSVESHPFKFLRWLTIVGVMIYFVLEFAEFSIIAWSPVSDSKEALNLIMFGPFWWVFWVIHLSGGLTALLLLIRGKSMPVIGTGAFLVAITFVSARLNILIPGQAVAQLKGLQNAFHHFRLSSVYQATVNEYLVAIFIGAFGVGVFFIGIKSLSKIFLVEETK